MLIESIYNIYGKSLIYILGKSGNKRTTSSIGTCMVDPLLELWEFPVNRKSISDIASRSRGVDNMLVYEL